MRIVLGFVAAFFYVITWASAPTYLDAYMNFGYDGLDNALIQTHIREVENYLNTAPLDKNAPEYLALLKLHANAQNYIALSERLKNCEDNQRMLTTRILDVVGNEIKSRGDIYVPCESFHTDLSSIQELNQHTKSILAPFISNSMQADLYQKSLTNSMKSLMQNQYQFQLNDFESDEAIKNFIERECQELCPSNVFKAQNYQQSDLFLALKAFKQTFSTIKRFDATEAAHHLNNLVDGEEGLNKILKAADELVGYEDGWVDDEPSFSDASSLLIDYYQARYNQIQVQDPVGRLLNTEVVRDRIGMAVTQVQDDMDEVGKSFRFKKHKRIRAGHITEGLETVKLQIREQIKELNQIEQKRLEQAVNINTHPQRLEQWREDDLKKILKTNPLAVGQQLFEKPFYADKVCSLVAKISTDDKNAALADKAWAFGGMVVGGALLATGIGSLAGAWILAGTATGATLASVAATAGLVGTAVGLAEAGRHTHQYFESRAEQVALEQAILSGAGDTQSATEAREAIMALRASKHDAIMAGVFSAVELGSVVRAASMAMYGAKAADDSIAIMQANRLMRSLDIITKNPRYVRMMQKLRTTVGGDKMSLYMGKLFSMAENLRAGMLLKMTRLAEAGKMNEMKRIVDEALEVAHRNCRL